MGFVHNSKVQPGRVRVTKRIMSKPDPRTGGRTLVARPGEEISLQDAVRRGIPESALEAVGHGGELALSTYRKAVKGAKSGGDDDDEARAQAAAEADAAAREQGTAAQRAHEREQAVASGAAEPTEFPRHRGGTNWDLSDGSIFSGTEEEAQDAEDQLAGGADGDPSAGTVEEVLKRVGDDQELATTALEAEQAKGDKARKTLVEQLQSIVDGGGNGGSENGGQ